ncbi:uncharacterized protein YjdB [Treponema rectale]|uniref:Uncharacterized protein YjdB n=1 Tax=Treponema rectale TaxID=744512 RepID=A0A840SK57_9SPIR|nr:Ig-like domain-containing protein [Treponema rectale]MBB5219732.1 uncharacterized protein YjdB [Treponema rectale]
MKKSIAAFMRNVFLLLSGALAAGSCFVSCSEENSGPLKVSVSQIILTDIDGNNEQTDVEYGDFLQLQATVLPENATDKSIVWSSDNEDLVSVDETGKVTVADFSEDDELPEETSSVITATAADGSEVFAAITVNAVEKVKHVESVKITSKYGDCILKDEDSVLTVTVLPEDADIKDFDIVSSDESVLSVVETETDGKTVYSVLGKGKGNASVKVTARDRFRSEHKAAEYPFTVLGEKIDVESVSLKSDDLVVSEESEEGTVNVVFTESAAALTLVKVPSDATLARENGTVYSIVSGEDLASIDEDGVVTFGENAGEVTVKVVASDRSDNSVEALYTFTVRKPVEEIILSAPESASFDEDVLLLARDDDPETESDESKILLSALVNPEDATVKNIIWTSSDEETAEVASDGTVTAKKAGEVVITANATDGSKVTAAQNIKIFIPVTAVSVSADKTESDVNTVITLTSAVEPFDADPKVLWEVVSGPAEIDQNGKVQLGDVSGDVIVKITSVYNEAKTAQITLRAMPDKTELKAEIEEAEKIIKRSVYSNEAKTVFRAAIDTSIEEVEDKYDSEADVENARSALAAAKKEIVENGIEKWDVSVAKGFEGGDQSEVRIFWSDDNWALTPESIVAEGTNKYTSFVITTGEVSVTAGNWWPSQPSVNGKTLITQPAFDRDTSLTVGTHVLTFTLAKGEDDYFVTVPFTLAVDEPDAAAETGEIEIALIDPRIKARAQVQKIIDAAAVVADNAKPSKYEEGAIDEFKAAIKTAEDSLALLAGDDATLEAIKTVGENLAEAEAEFNAKKVIGQWDVEILRRTNDQTTVTVKWVDDAWKLHASRDGDVINTSFVHEEGTNACTAFVIDETVSHVFWPDAAADFVTGDKYVSVKPAFREPALFNANHTLTFTVLADDGNEYDVTVTFAFAGKSNTDESQAIVDDVVIRKADKTEKLKAKLAKEISAAQTLYEDSDAADFADGAYGEFAAAIADASSVLENATTEDEVKTAMEVLSAAVAAFRSSEKIDNWKFEYRQHDNDQYTLIVSWASAEWAIDLNSVSNGNATFVTDGDKASHTYWPADQNKVESNRVIFNPANNQVAGENALGEHTLTFDLKPLGSDTIYDVTLRYRLDANNSYVTILEKSVTARE